MAETLQVTAKLLPVGQELHARAGDRLLVVAGVVVGVYSGTIPAHPVLPAPRAAPEPPAPPRQPPRGAAARGPSDERQRTREAIVEALQEAGGTIRAIDLPAALKGLSTKPWHIRGALADAEAAGQIEIGGLPGKGRVYSLRGRRTDLLGGP